MPATLSGSTLRITGTETLSGLGSNANITVSGVGLLVYTVTSSLRVDLRGTLTIDPRSEMLVVPWAGSNNDPGFNISSGGHLIIGRGVTSPTSGRSPAVMSYGFGLGLVISADGPQCCDDGSMDVRGGGHLEIHGGTIWTRGVHRWLSGCQVTIRDGWIMNVDPTGASATNNTRIRIEEGGGIDIDGLVTSNLQLDYRSTEAFGKFEGLQPRDIAIGVENGVGGSTRGRIKTWRSVPDPRDTALAFASNWDCADDVRIINAEAGSATLIVPDRTTSLPSASRSASTTFQRFINAQRTIIEVNAVTGFSAGQWIQIGTGATVHRRTIESISGLDLTLNVALPTGIAAGTHVTNITAHGGRIYHEVRFRLIDADGDGIAAAKVHCVDTNHGERRVTDTAGTIDETANRTYTATAGNDGVTPTISILTGMWYRMNEVVDLAAPDGNEIVDIRGKNDTPGEDLFDFGVWAYGYLGQIVQNVVCNGLQERVVDVALLQDPAITEQDIATVLAYTQLTSAAEVYDFAAAQIYSNHSGQAGMPFSRVGQRLTWASRENVQLRASGAFVLRRVGTDTTEIVTGPTFAGDIVTGGTVTVGAGVTVEGAITDSTGILVIINGLPANASATVIAWPASQGNDDRENEISGAIAASDTTSTSVSLRLAANTAYKITADAISYKRSAIIDLDTTSQASLTISLEEITDAQGNVLVANTLSGLTTAQQAQVTYVDWQVDKIYLRSTGPIGFAAAAYAVEHGQSSATAQVSLHHPARIEAGRIIFPSSSSQQWRKHASATGVPDIEAFQVGKDGSSDAADYIDFEDGGVKYKSEPPITAPVNVVVAPVQASQADFSSLMSGVDQAVKDTYKGTGGTGGGGGTALTQSQFDALMAAVPDATKQQYGGAGGADVHSIYERVVTPQSAEVTSTIDAVGGIYTTASNSIFDGSISVDGGSAVSIALTPVTNEIRAVDIVASINSLVTGVTASFDTATQRMTIVRDDAGHSEYFEFGGTSLWALVGFSTGVIYRGTDGLPFLRDIEAVIPSVAQIAAGIEDADVITPLGNAIFGDRFRGKSSNFGVVTAIGHVIYYEVAGNSLASGFYEAIVANPSQPFDPTEWRSVDVFSEFTGATSPTTTLRFRLTGLTPGDTYLLQQRGTETASFQFTVDGQGRLRPDDITTSATNYSANSRSITFRIAPRLVGSHRSISLSGNLLDLLEIDPYTVWGSDGRLSTGAIVEALKSADFEPGTGDMTLGQVLATIKSGVSNISTDLADVSTHDTDEIAERLRRGAKAIAASPTKATAHHSDPNDDYYDFGSEARAGTVTVNGTDYSLTVLAGALLDDLRAVYIAGEINTALANSGASARYDTNIDQIIIESDEIGADQTIQFAGSLFIDLLGFDADHVYTGLDSIVPQISAIVDGVTAALPTPAVPPTADQIAARLTRLDPAVAVSPTMATNGEYPVTDGVTYEGQITLMDGRPITARHTASSANLDGADLAALLNNIVGLSVTFGDDVFTFTTDALGARATIQFAGDLFTSIMGFDSDTIYRGAGPIVPQTMDISAALAIPSATDIVTTLLQRNVSAMQGSPESFVARLQSLATTAEVQAAPPSAADIATAVAAPSASDIVTALLAADVEDGTGTATLAGVLASIRTAIAALPTSQVTASQLVAALQAADFEPGSGTDTLSEILQSILTAVGAISPPSADSIADAVLEHGTGAGAPNVIDLLRICAAVLAGRASVTGSTITYRTIGDDVDAVAVGLGSDGNRSSTSSRI